MNPNQSITNHVNDGKTTTNIHKTSEKLLFNLAEACVPIGGILWFALGMVIACDCSVFDMGNMCGLFAVFITGPIGSIAGGVTGWFFFRRRFVTP